MKIKSLIYLFLIVVAFLFFACEKSVSSITSATPSDFYQIDESRCIACGNCYDVCPHNAIQFNLEKPVIIQSKCKQCGECALVCPEDAIH